MSVLGTVNDPRFEAVQSSHAPERMRALLDAWFARAGRAERVVSLAVQRVFYMPGIDFNAVYALELERGSERESQLLFGDLCYDADAPALVAKAERKTAKGKFVAPRLGSPAYHLPEIGMALWTFPNDPKLRSLRAAMQPPLVREALARQGGPGPNGGNGWVLGAIDQTLVRYIPRKRCVFRYGVEWKRAAAASADGAPTSILQHIWAKVYDDAAAAQAAHAILAALWRGSLADSRWLRVPRPLAPDFDRATVYQGAVHGESMARQAVSVSAGRVAEIARGLALLQQARLPVQPVLALEDEFEKMQGQAHLVAMIHPQTAPALESIQAQLGARLPGLPRLPLVPCHGTFKLAHLLDDGSHTSLVDFDSFVLADPIYDVANFIADLHYLEAHGVLPPGRATQLAGIFHDAWTAHVPWGKRQAVLDWYVASLLVRKQALKPVKHLHPDAPAKIERILCAAGARLGG